MAAAVCACDDTHVHVAARNRVGDMQVGRVLAIEGNNKRKDSEGNVQDGP